MHIDLTDKTALVTGSTKGIGYATARALAEAGATVIVNGRSEETTQAAANRLVEEVPGVTIRAASGDLGVQAGCDKVIAACPTVDILVNNTGIFTFDDFFETPDDRWQEYFDVNVMSSLRMTRHYLKPMMKAGWGRVVMVASQGGVQLEDELIPYGVSKAAQIALARGAAQAARRSGVTVNSILPGPTFSEGIKDALARIPDFADIAPEAAADTLMSEWRTDSLRGKIGQPEEVASLIVYLCSAQAANITGTALRVDGGITGAVI